jgi:signal transduction histidine kinase
VTPRRYLILSVVILCAVVSAQQAASWWSDAARTEASQRLDAARVQQLAASQLRRSLDDVRHALDQAALATTLSGAVPAGALDRNREDLTSSLARLNAPPGTVAERDIADLTAAVSDFFGEWDAFAAEAVASPASAAAHIAGARRRLLALGTETVPRFSATIDAAVIAAQADSSSIQARATMAGWAVFAAGITTIGLLALLGRPRVTPDPAPPAMPPVAPLPPIAVARAEAPARAPTRAGGLEEAARLQAIGRLAGGVAHDFNNLLTVIKGHMEKLLESAGQSPTRLRLEEVQRAADRAAALTSQLLAFSQRQVLAPRMVNLNDIISDQSSLARPLLDDRIELVLDLDPALWTIRADPGQCAQVVMNLVVNARDALMNGGRIVIRTANYPEGWRTDNDRLISPAVELSVSDNGVGMDDAVRRQVFEPFFTTKSAGPATGLGLSTVHGIVKQSGGDVVVSSAPGKGSTFTVILPAVPAESDSQDDNARHRGRTGRIPGILH